MEEVKDNLDIIDEGKKRVRAVEYTINGRTFHTGKLGLRQQAKLAAFFIRILTIDVKFKKLLEKFKEPGRQATREGDFLMILEELDEDQIAALFAILLDTDDIEYLKNNMGPADSFNIISIVSKYNDWYKLKKNL